MCLIVFGGGGVRHRRSEVTYACLLKVDVVCATALIGPQCRLVVIPGCCPYSWR